MFAFRLGGAVQHLLDDDELSCIGTEGGNQAMQLQGSRVALVHWMRSHMAGNTALGCCRDLLTCFLTKPSVPAQQHSSHHTSLVLWITATLNSLHQVAQFEVFISPQAHSHVARSLLPAGASNAGSKAGHTCVVQLHPIQFLFLGGSCDAEQLQFKRGFHAERWLLKAGL